MLQIDFCDISQMQLSSLKLKKIAKKKVNEDI